jgi:hypothetical protein
VEDLRRAVAASGSLQKAELLSHYREIAARTIERARSLDRPQDRAKLVNEAMSKAQDDVLALVQTEAHERDWPAEARLEQALLTSYTNLVVMIEARHKVWPYDYMTFSRRVGELWERFCRLCWRYPLDPGLTFFEPPMFDDVKAALAQDLGALIDSLQISEEQKVELKRSYDVVWSFVTSGGISLGVDIHFTLLGQRYVVDFKSGFGSNEKGNTNRLLLVGSIYKSLDEDYECLLLLRSAEDEANNYLQRIKASGLWAIFCGPDTYEEIKRLTGCDLATWMSNNIDWASDLEATVLADLEESDLFKYLRW